MADITVSVNKVIAKDTVTAVTASPATEDVAGTAQIFNITPTKPNERMTITCSVANSHGSVTLTVAAGGFVNAPASALSLVIPQNTTKTFQLEPTKYLSSAGVYAITATPASGKQLTTNHAFTMTAIETMA